MEINVLNKNFEKIAIVDTYSSLMCGKRYYDVGGLDLQIEATTETLSIFKHGYFLTRNDDETVYRIEAIELDTRENHDNSLIIGAVDCKDILKQRIIWDTVSFNGTVENYIRKLITDNVIAPTIAERQISNFALKEAKGFAETINQQVSYDNLLEKIEALCKAYALGWTISFENGVFYFDLYKGVDRSKSQTVNNPVVFSPEYDNLVSSKYNFDSQDYKNVALVGGEGEGKDRKRVSVGSAVGLDRFEMFVDSSTSSTNTDEGTSETDYINQLRSEGTDELAKQATTTSFEGEIVADSYKYKSDYNLGDIVTIINEYGISVDARIVEIVETWDDKGYSLEPKFEYMEVQEITNVESSVLTESNMMLLSESGETALITETVVSQGGVKISDLPNATSLDEDSYFPVVQNGITKKASVDLIEFDDSNLQAQINNKVSKVTGKGLSTNDFTNEEKEKLASLENYDDSSIIETLETKVDKIYGKGLSTNDYTTEEKSKLATLENYDDSDIITALGTKVDKVTGKGLSTNDYSTAEKNKLASLENYDDSSILSALENKVDKVTGQGLSSNNFTNEYKNKLESLSNYDDTELRNSITTTVNNAIAEVVANAPEDFDTLKEMADWIAGHENDVSAMNSAIQENKANLTTEITNRTNADTELQEQIDNKVDKVTGKGLSTNDYTTAEKNKLAGLSNYDDTELLEQIAEEITNRTNADSDLVEQINNKVDKVSGKGLSSNDFTNDLKTKLDGLSNYDDSSLVEQIENVYTKAETNNLLSNKANLNGSTANFQSNTHYYRSLGNWSDYEQIVIPILEITSARDMNKYSNGKIFAHRGNGLYADPIVEWKCNKSYSSTASEKFDLVVYKQHLFKFATFMYNEKKYVGVLFNSQLASVGFCYFDGYTNDNGAVNIVKFYNSNTETVLNEEIYNSIEELNVSVVGSLGEMTSSYFETTTETSSFEIAIDTEKDVLQVYVNGFKLVPNIDYSYTNTEVTLTKAVDAGTKVELVVYTNVEGEVNLANVLTTEISSYGTRISELAEATSVNDSCCVPIIQDGETKKIYFENIIPTGTIFPCVSNATPEGWLLCDGSQYNIEDYPKLYEILGTDTLPDLRGRFLQGANDNLNTTIEAGLPNITGDTGGVSWANRAPVSGAFYRTSATYPEANDGTVYSKGVKFDASRVSDVYGKSETVQPPAYTVNYIVKAT